MTRKGFAVPMLLGIAVLGTLTGCSPPRAGYTGITVDEDGRPLGVMIVCEGHIDGATLYDSDHPNAPDHLGRWSRGKPAKGFTTWSLETGGRGWNPEVPTATLEPHRTYDLYGWTEDSSWSAASVEFTAAQVERLVPGLVRYYKGDGAGTDRNGYATVPMEKFRSEACRQE
ncbi:hypothetical protein [Streptomyces sp. NPDC026673]|uniref:hypothetical protein n=1 Tax=Streptomyces sp. NPDC026673 TaxID=3155724 RepID=UPI0033DAEE2A